MLGAPQRAPPEVLVQLLSGAELGRVRGWGCCSCCCCLHRAAAPRVLVLLVHGASGRRQLVLVLVLQRPLPPPCTLLLLLVLRGRRPGRPGARGTEGVDRVLGQRGEGAAERRGVKGLCQPPRPQLVQQQAGVGVAVLLPHKVGGLRGRAGGRLGGRASAVWVVACRARAAARRAARPAHSPRLTTTRSFFSHALARTWAPRCSSARCPSTDTRVRQKAESSSAWLRTSPKVRT